MLYQNPKLKRLRQKLRNNTTDAERKLWSMIRKKEIMNFKFTRQYGVGKYILDFYCPTLRLALELDGSQHMEAKNAMYDEQRAKFLNFHNIKIIRFYDNEVFKNPEKVLERIVKIIKNNENPIQK